MDVFQAAAAASERGGAGEVGRTDFRRHSVSQSRPKNLVFSSHLNPENGHRGPETAQK